MTPNADDVVIVGAARTPIGAFQGGLSSLSAPALGACAIRAALSRAGIAPGGVAEVLMGCVLPAGVGQAPARQASLMAGLPEAVPCTTVNKVCGSGMKTAMIAYEALHVRRGDVIVAGGMESMSNAPYLLPKVRGGLRLGHGEVKDHMFLDGLEDASEKGRLMGAFAEDAASHFGFSRQDQDGYALESLRRALAAQEAGGFAQEIEPVRATVRGADLGADLGVDRDEQPVTARPERIPSLKPAFREGGTVTAANASSISDGAAALVLTTAREAVRRGLRPLARVAGVASHAQAPAWFTTAPVGALAKLASATGWRLDEVGLFEINEAFAVVVLAAMRELGLSHDRVNVNGGACALGHPIGASGARILVTLLAAMLARGEPRGAAAICIGGGEATAMALELV